MKDPVVSVCILTYNQSKVIKDAIESILAQRTSFPFELVIGEDCSTDTTRAICLEYKEKYPEQIRLFLPNQNVGVTTNCRESLLLCQGKYIAFCEGDDYWIDPLKLQKQVDFMENNPDFSMIYHKVNEYWVAEDKMRVETLNVSEIEQIYSALDLAKVNLIHTPSVLFRNQNMDYSLLKRLDGISDYFIWMMCARNGKIKYLPEVMAVYRVSAESTWARKSDIYRIGRWIQLLLHVMNIWNDNHLVYSSLFLQAKNYYKSFINLCQEENDNHSLDQTTKKLLLLSYDFQQWWFIYMIHIRKSRFYKMKYYVFLLKKRKLNSIFLLKKVLY